MRILSKYLDNRRVNKEQDFQRRVIAAANQAAARAMKGREKKFLASVTHVGKYRHPNDDHLVSKDAVEEDVKRVGEWVRDREIEKYIYNPQELSREERRQARYANRSLGLYSRPLLAVDTCVDGTERHAK